MGAVIVRPDGFVGWRTQSSETKPRETLRGVYQRPLCKWRRARIGRATYSKLAPYVTLSRETRRARTKMAENDLTVIAKFMVCRRAYLAPDGQVSRDFLKVTAEGPGKFQRSAVHALGDVVQLERIFGV